MVDDISIRKLHDLVIRLIRLTELGRIRWKETGQPDAFLFSSQSSSVVVGSRDADGELPMFLRVLDQDGDVVDVLSTENLMTADWFDDLRQLHVLARRDATDADRVLDALLAELPDVTPWD